jgi:Protein of unknown function (DUF3105)
MPTKKMDAKRAAKQRRLEIETAKRRARAAERRRSWLLAGAALGVGVILVAAVEVPRMLAPTPIAKRSLSGLGVSASKAACDAVKTPPLEAKGDAAATTNGKATVVKYTSTPPTSGKSFTTAADNTVHYYGAGEGPAPETLVRNLQNGYTIVWYLPTLNAKQVAQLTYVGDAGAKVALSDKFIVTPWDTKRGAFPAGKNVAIAAWDSVQFCGGISGKTIQTFINNHPPSKAPTPTGT